MCVSLSMIKVNNELHTYNEYVDRGQDKERKKKERKKKERYACVVEEVNKLCRYRAILSSVGGVWGSDSGLFSKTAFCQLLMAKQELCKRGCLWTHRTPIA